MLNPIIVMVCFISPEENGHAVKKQPLETVYTGLPRQDGKAGMQVLWFECYFSSEALNNWRVQTNNLMPPGDIWLLAFGSTLKLSLIFTRVWGSGVCENIPPSMGTGAHRIQGAAKLSATRVSICVYMCVCKHLACFCPVWRFALNDGLTKSCHVY